jgi:prepilin-type N-terminal cleavage/methylation domain-containing protein
LGLTLIEIMIAMAILTVGLVAVGKAAVKCSQIPRSTQDYLAAHDTARDIVEKIRNGNLTAQFQAYSAAPNSVVGGQNVQVQFPVSILTRYRGSAPPATARFIDTNGDGYVDLNAASTDPASLLPVRVTVTRNKFKYVLECLLTEQL